MSKCVIAIATAVLLLAATVAEAGGGYHHRGPYRSGYYRVGGGWGWGGGWGGWGFPYEPSYDVVVRTNYEAYAEIVLLTADQAAKEPRALAAADVIARLGPDAMPPNPR